MSQNRKMPIQLQKRTILITGGTSGIGLELARQLCKNNTVLVTGRDPQKLQAVRQALPAVHTFQSDVSDAKQIQQLHHQVLHNFPQLDTLINNAGIMRNLDLQLSHDLTDLTREIEINLSGPLRMVQQFLPHLQKQPRSLIVNVSSGLAFVPLSISPVYSAAKAALHAYTRALRLQLENSTVAVVELAPPGVETPLFRAEFAEELQGQKGMEVQVLVRQALKGMEQGKQEIRPGLSNVLHLMGRLAPGVMARQMARGMKAQKAVRVQQ
ncbi:SDR family oxidoreductase [Deinococcus roseus]|uniref:Oxidoreductase n=1 Tax=Deinococcus roseus TaxID=392414 RepID=A0ABQ2CZ80_9DEIO|nr:SDR family NAD(P)-dependent oxidoreductase [Deinococcus roseus]GGJ35580.1 oxidoreductase [Deinococcus roseus]